jgi:hypothetical protein
MAYNTKSHTYYRFAPLWKKCSDVCKGGEDAIKINGEYYLPRPDGMEEPDYQGYLSRAEFFNASGRTLDGVHGLMFRKDVTIDVPEQYRPYLDNVDGKGTDIYKFISECTYETLVTGWGGVLVDAPTAENIRTKAEAEKQGIAPYLQYFKAKDIFNWHYADIGRKKTLDRACLHEKIESRNGDDFTYTLRDRYHLLMLNDNLEYTEIIKNQEGSTTSEFTPKKNGASFNHIPFYTLPNIEPEKPMFLDLVNLNLHWYIKSADLENGAHWTGVPTPYILGYEPEVEYDENGTEKPRKPIYLGGSSMLTFPQGVTGIGYLEFAGSGLSQLQSMLDTDEERMAILGARIISQEKKGVESAETAKIHRAGENSVIATFANNMSNVFKKILIEYLSWCSESEINPDDITVKINTDYEVSQMSSAELASMVSLWQSGGISKRVLFSNLKEGEVIPNEYSFEDLETEIADEKESSRVFNFATQTMETPDNNLENNTNTAEEKENGTV